MTESSSMFERDMRRGMAFLVPKPTEEQMREFLDMCLPSDRFLQVAEKARIWMNKHGLKEKP